MAFPNANVKSPVLSPSLNESSASTIVDEDDNELELVAAVPLSADGEAGLGGATLEPGIVSQVTGRKEGAQVVTASGKKMKVMALVGLDPAGEPIPFAAPSAQSVSGKFQSAVLTGTGAEQDVAHGLGVIPSLVLVAIQDTNGIALPHAILEGAHDATNLKITVTLDVKYKVIAFA